MYWIVGMGRLCKSFAGPWSFDVRLILFSVLVANRIFRHWCLRSRGTLEQTSIGISEPQVPEYFWSFVFFLSYFVPSSWLLRLSRRVFGRVHTRNTVSLIQSGLRGVSRQSMKQKRKKGVFKSGKRIVGASGVSLVACANEDEAKRVNALSSKLTYVAYEFSIFVLWTCDSSCEFPKYF